MLIQYIQAALRRARYRMLEEGEGFFGEIPGFDGLWAHAMQLEDCREALESALSDWLLVKLRRGDRDLPVLKGLDLNRGKSVVRVKRRKVA